MLRCMYFLNVGIEVLFTILAEFRPKKLDERIVEEFDACAFIILEIDVEKVWLNVRKVMFHCHFYIRLDLP